MLKTDTSWIIYKRKKDRTSKTKRLRATILLKINYSIVCHNVTFVLNHSIDYGQEGAVVRKLIPPLIYVLEINFSDCGFFYFCGLLMADIR